MFILKLNIMVRIRKIAEPGLNVKITFFVCFFLHQKYSQRLMHSPNGCFSHFYVYPLSLSYRGCKEVFISTFIFQIPLGHSIMWHLRTS